jgi:MarR family transcriptional regulator, 2-MHQ and catechol-resistance regulon repressor
MSVPTLQQALKKRRPFDRPEQEAMINLWRLGDWSLNQFGQLFRDFGLTCSQYNVLRILRGAGEPLPVQEIAGRMIQPVPAMTGLIDRLEKAGLVERRRISADRRVIHVAIARRALGLLRKLDEPVLELHRELLAGLSKDEVLQLNALLAKARNSAP